MRKTVPILTALLATTLGGCDATSTAICVTAMSPWIRLPAVPSRPGAGYFDVDATPGLGDLVSVSSPGARRIEIHETITTNGVASMRRVERIAADGCNRYATSDGRHLMIFGLDPSLRPGDEIPLVLYFEHGQHQTISADVRAPGDG